MEVISLNCGQKERGLSSPFCARLQIGELYIIYKAPILYIHMGRKKMEQNNTSLLLVGSPERGVLHTSSKSTCLILGILLSGHQTIGNPHPCCMLCQCRCFHQVNQTATQAAQQPLTQWGEEGVQVASPAQSAKQVSLDLIPYAIFFSLEFCKTEQC